jgi:PAS domain S-box-containing protein
MYNVCIKNLNNKDTFSYKIHEFKDIFNVKKDKLPIPSKDYEDLMEKIQIYNYIPHGVDVIIPLNEKLEDFIYIYFGSNFWKDNNYNPQELTGTRLTHIFNENLAKQVLRTIQKVYIENKKEDLLLEIFDEEENIILSENIFFIKVNNSVAMFSQDNTQFEQLKKEEDKLYATSKEGLITLTEDFKLLRVNKTFFKILTYTKEEFKSVGNFDNINDYVEALSTLGINFHNVISEYFKIINREIFSSEIDEKFIGKNGKVKYLRIYSIPTFYEGKFAVQSSINDITEIKEKENRALHLEEKIFSLENLTSAAVSFNQNGKVNWSPGIYAILNSTPISEDKTDYLLKRFVIEEDKQVLEENLNNLSIDNPDADFIIRVKSGNDEIKYLHILLNQTYDENDNLEMCLGYYRDVTELYVHEKEMEEALETKQILLSEVHDRVKNNLQIILSLLNLELRYHPNNPERALKNTRDRIQTMVLVLELVYKSEDDEIVDTGKYIEDRLNNLFVQYNVKNIKLHIDIADFKMDMNEAIPLGLICGELAGNTMKYAFPNGEFGNFFMKYTTFDNCYTFDIYDDGVGMSDDFDFNDTSSLSLIIVKSLVNQLNGDIEQLDLDKGFGVKIIFKK